MYLNCIVMGLFCSCQSVLHGFLSLLVISLKGRVHFTIHSWINELRNLVALREKGRAHCTIYSWINKLRNIVALRDDKYKAFSVPQSWLSVKWCNWIYLLPQQVDGVTLLLSLPMLVRAALVILELSWR